MNLQNIINDLKQADPEFGERVSPRRNLIKNIGRVTALTALPLAFGSLLKKAYGKTNATVLEVLNFALTLEYLEAEFYTNALNNMSASFIPDQASRDAFTVIRNHEDAHVAFLTGAITQAFGAPNVAAKPTFDFSGGSGPGGPGFGMGPFAAAFTNYELFLAVAQVFEDTGVRAYKGSAGDLMGDNDVLTAALNIHSVEARHASKIRQMRRARGGATIAGDLRPWITGSQTNITGVPASAAAAVQPSYNGEENAVQLSNITITGLTSGSITISNEDATEAFDEGLSMTAVLDIVAPFIV